MECRRCSATEENLATLTRLVEHFERAVESRSTWTRSGARQIAKGTVGLRIPVDRFVCKRKLSQDKDDLSRRQVIAGLREPGPYRLDAGWSVAPTRWSATWEAERSVDRATRRSGRARPASPSTRPASRASPSSPSAPSSTTG